MNPDRRATAHALTREPRPAARSDIQGLRALAVIAVIVNHAIGWPLGGFLGVDVFFVISGYLICGQLIREYERTRRISFVDFYRRRIRRIMPAALVTLVVTVGASALVYVGARAQSIAVDGVWAALFGANWHFAIEGTDYWAADGSVSPLRHFWSLSVEEQFYFVVPAVMLLALVIANRRGLTSAGHRWVLFVVLGLLTAGSFAWALKDSSQEAQFAYFSTFSRAWELGVGAVLVAIAPRLRTMPSALRHLLAWTGLAAIVASMALIDGQHAFPAPVGGIPVVATALIIAAGTGAVRSPLLLFRPAPVRYVGDISYSLYLWHFPVIILLGALLPAGPVGLAIELGAVLVVSVASYHLVETPIRRSAWLLPEGDPRPEPRERRDRTRPRRLDTLDRVLVAGIAVAVVLVIGAAAVTRPATVAWSAPGGAAVAVDGTTPTTADGKQAAAVTAALAATSFPAFSPSIDSLGTKAWSSSAAVKDCGDVSAANESRCVVGPASAKKDVAVLGDSFGIAWMPGLEGALEPAGYRVHPYTYGECPSMAVDVLTNSGGAFPQCTAHRTWAIARIKALKPDLVILADSAGTYDRLVGKPTPTPGLAEMAAGLKSTLAALKGLKVVVLQDPPAGVNLQQCVTRISSPDNCVSTIGSIWYSLAKQDEQIATAAGDRYVVTRDWFCDDQNRCPGFVGRTPVRVDIGHLTPAYSRQLAEPLADAILRPARARA